MNLLAPLGRETHDGSGVIAFGFGLIRFDGVVEGHGRSLEGLVEDDDKIVSEIFGNPTRVAGRVTDDFLLFGNDSYRRTPVESVDHHIRIFSLGEGKAEECRPVGHGHLGRYVVVGQINLIVVRFGHLGLVREPTGPLVLVEDPAARYRHERKLTVVVHPGAGLVCLFETLDFVGRVGIGPPVAHVAGLRGPEVHAPRHGDSRVGIAGREFKFRLRAHQRVDPVDGRKSGKERKPV